MEGVLISILTGVFSAGFTVAAVKIDLSWIKAALKTHSKYHDNHFVEINNLKVKVAKNA